MLGSAAVRRRCRDAARNAAAAASPLDSSIAPERMLLVTNEDAGVAGCDPRKSGNPSFTAPGFEAAAACALVPTAGWCTGFRLWNLRDAATKAAALSTSS